MKENKARKKKVTTKNQNVAIGLWIAAAIGGIILLTKKPGAAPPPPPPPGLANLYGVVSDLSTGQPLSGVLVELGGAPTQTDSSGGYAFPNIQPGDYVITFSKDGYQTITF